MMNNPRVFDYRGRETERDCSTVMFNLASDFKAAQRELAKFDEGMRALACSLGAGGYNAETLSADELVGKVQWGIDNIVSVQEQRLTAAQSELAALREELAKLGDDYCKRMDELIAAEQRNATLLDLLRECQPALDKAGYSTWQIDAALQPTESGASE